jgi:hypothetical protein
MLHNRCRCTDLLVMHGCCRVVASVAQSLSMRTSANNAWLLPQNMQFVTLQIPSSKLRLFLFSFPDGSANWLIVLSQLPCSQWRLLLPAIEWPHMHAGLNALVFKGCP